MMNNRLAGVFGMIGGAGLMALEARHVLSGVTLNGASIEAPDLIGYLVWGAGMACAFWAMDGLGVTGRGTLRRLPLWIAILGFVTMAIGSLTDLIGITSVISNPIYWVSWPALLIGTIGTAILALVARTWAGWRKFAPLLIILVVPTFAVLGESGTLLFGLAWMLLGFAVFSTGAEQARPAAALA